MQSRRLNLSGVCDVVEFRSDPKGVSLAGREDLWRPYPVEYKRGSPTPGDADIVQLCVQALCLEEILLCDVPEGYLFYGETRRRERVEFTLELRGHVEALPERVAGPQARDHHPSLPEGEDPLGPDSPRPSAAAYAPPARRPGRLPAVFMEVKSRSSAPSTQLPGSASDALAAAPHK